MTAKQTIRLFVYGSLKRGCSNHLPLCQSGLSINPATIRGRLALHSSGYPMAIVPEEDILATGTSDPLADAATESLFTAILSHRTHAWGVSDLGGTDWGVIRGELIVFEDPGLHLPRLDDFENFHPDGFSWYRRVLVPASPEGGPPGPAWVYVCGGSAEGLQPLGSDSWND